MILPRFCLPLSLSLFSSPPFSLSFSSSFIIYIVVSSLDECFRFPTITHPLMPRSQMTHHSLPPTQFSLHNTSRSRSISSNRTTASNTTSIISVDSTSASLVDTACNTLDSAPSYTLFESCVERQGASRQQLDGSKPMLSVSRLKASLSLPFKKKRVSQHQPARGLFRTDYRGLPTGSQSTLSSDCFVRS